MPLIIVVKINTNTHRGREYELRHKFRLIIEIEKKKVLRPKYFTEIISTQFERCDDFHYEIQFTISKLFIWLEFYKLFVGSSFKIIGQENPVVQFEMELILSAFAMTIEFQFSIPAQSAISLFSYLYFIYEIQFIVKLIQSIIGAWAMKKCIQLFIDIAFHMMNKYTFAIAFHISRNVIWLSAVLVNMAYCIRTIDIFMGFVLIEWVVYDQ